MILLVDNYDSFTYNLYQYLRTLGHEVTVKRNDAIGIPAIAALAPSHIVLSPGPGRPENAGCIVEIVRQFSGKIPIFGVCLGHQAIGYAFGAEITYAAHLLHGKNSEIVHDGKTIYTGIKNPFTAVRYHSLVVKRATLPEHLEISAWTETGEIMGLRHKNFRVEGVQFHPESIGTKVGMELLEHFFDVKAGKKRIQTAIATVSSGKSLSQQESEQVMLEISEGEATPAQIAGILTALSLKGESAEEIAGFAAVMRSAAVPIRRPAGKQVLDTCGTGGDDRGTFNISTTAAIVASGAGVIVAKHGNRSVTSRCGSADVLEALGVDLQASADLVSDSIEKVGIGFLFAPMVHRSMKHAVPVRRELGIRTVFNLLGPLTNPTAPECQIVGVFNPGVMEKTAQALIALKVRRAMVVHGVDGLDEITGTDSTQVIEVRDGWMKKYFIHPSMVGLPVCSHKDLRGNTLKDNCEIVHSILSGETGSRRNIVVFNAAAAIYLYGLASDLNAAARLAEKSIDSGAAKEKLLSMIAASISGKSHE